MMNSSILCSELMLMKVLVSKQLKSIWKQEHHMIVFTWSPCVIKQWPANLGFFNSIVFHPAFTFFLSFLLSFLPSFLPPSLAPLSFCWGSNTRPYLCPVQTTEPYLQPSASWIVLSARQFKVIFSPNSMGPLYLCAPLGFKQQQVENIQKDLWLDWTWSIFSCPHSLSNTGQASIFYEVLSNLGMI